MEFRKTNINDLPEVMKIIREAQSYFKEQGIDQWQNNYPNEEVIKNDIKNNHSYVLVKDGKIAATTVASFMEKRHMIIFMKVSGFQKINI